MKNFNTFTWVAALTGLLLVGSSQDAEAQQNGHRSRDQRAQRDQVYRETNQNGQVFYNNGPTVNNQDRRERNSVPNASPTWTWNPGENHQNVDRSGRGHYDNNGQGYYDNNGQFRSRDGSNHVDRSGNQRRRKWQNVNGQWVRTP